MFRVIVRERAGRLQTYVQYPGGLLAEPVGAEVTFAGPLSSADLEEIRWYVEDYLLAPFAVYEDRGRAAAERAPALGIRLFDTLFGAGAPGREAYERARAASAWSLTFASNASSFLGLPWELMYDPAEPRAPLALTVPITRSADVGQAPAVVPDGSRLRVLVVISRPFGLDDAPFRIVARPLLEELARARLPVELEVLRPPTFDAFRERLAAAHEAGVPYHVVHFDGHGTFDAAVAGSGPGVARGELGRRGALLFERASGGEAPIDAADFGAALESSGVPLVVLNACQAGTVASPLGAEADLGATVAVSALRAGVSGVVAMAYSVFTTAAARFVAVFYRALLRGVDAELAVLAGRAALYQAPGRPSPAGSLPLADWFVPVYYGRGHVRFALARQPGPPAAAVSVPRQTGDSAVGFARALAFRPSTGFVGRDREFQILEVALRTRHAVVVHGLAGVGKTELCRAFGDWMVRTGGLDAVGGAGLLFFQTFRPGGAAPSARALVYAVGTAAFGPTFATGYEDEDAARAEVVRLFRERRALLILDNLETAFTMRGGVDPGPADEQRAFATLVEEIAREARVGVVVTSRAAEPWLGDDADVLRLELQGLGREDAIAYADYLLVGSVEAAQRRRQRGFADLLDRLQGHPLTMRLVLPYLARHDAATILRALDGVTPWTALDRNPELAAGDLDSAPIPSSAGLELGHAVAYSLNHLDAADRECVVALALFADVADVDVLSAMSRDAAVPSRFRGPGFENPRATASPSWPSVCRRAESVGLLTALVPRRYGMYEMHPALPGYLAEVWRRSAGPDHQAERAAAERAVVRAYAWMSGFFQSDEARKSRVSAHSVLQWQYAAFARAARRALVDRLCPEAAAIVQLLAAYGLNQGRLDEVQAWADDCRTAADVPYAPAVQQSQDFAADDDPRPLRGLADAIEVDIARARRDLATVAAADAARLRDAEAANESPRQADAHLRLGALATDRGDLDAASTHSQSALALYDADDDQEGVSDAHHALGIVAQARGDWETARGHLTRAAAIRQERHDHEGWADTQHQLGMLAYTSGDHDAAERHCRASLEVDEAHGRVSGVAKSYHTLGLLAQERGDLAGARAAYTQALQLKTQYLHDPVSLATTWMQLGTVEVAVGDAAKADAWYEKAEPVFRHHGAVAALAVLRHQRGVVFEMRGDAALAEHAFRESLELEVNAGNRLGEARSCLTLSRRADRRRDPRVATAYAIRALAALPSTPVVPERAEAIARMEYALATAGLGVVRHLWREVTGVDMPADVTRRAHTYP